MVFRMYNGWLYWRIVSWVSYLYIKNVSFLKRKGSLLFIGFNTRLKNGRMTGLFAGSHDFGNLLCSALDADSRWSNWGLALGRPAAVLLASEVQVFIPWTSNHKHETINIKHHLKPLKKNISWTSELHKSWRLWCAPPVISWLTKAPVTSSL